ncbi:DUF2264 domain-containing protein [Butyrivibrio sp. YAB3001]|uniref:DUF2264 domain-containing protein n=1 Tax=Butyrivibrio sp. YAB3001 TaxID=1520812 RepID=UPI0008F630B1|nr:DUF2264 domain-containing protein [Butyrivibrio sp. YAB3001]SFC61522.1 hypothetical protein SAMN02910398_02705 [Butyrivibrio sp. YAB3001]
MKFEPKHLDYELSPYTGLTRESWIEAAEYLLGGIFDNISSIEAPVVMPRYETEVTYPSKDAPMWRKKAEVFEGLCRSFFIAAPLIHIKPELELNEICIREYYKKQVLEAVTEGAPNYVLNYSEMRALDKSNNPTACYQQTVETAALVICLWLCREELWDTYSKEEKDRIAAFLSDFAHANTVPQNWRLFNMLDLAFLYMNGYEIDEDIMRDHAQNILAYYVGDGWYRDGQSFDYYSCWAFNMYTAIWNNWYGYEKEPYIAAKFEQNSNELMKTYPDFFDSDGFTNMWGRSGIYRNAATSAFDGNLLMQNNTVDPGLARRICSGSLLQFFTRDDFLWKGVPTLGFYGPFVPLVQGYSCAESPMWLAKAFLCLHLPADHPFWTAKENNGTWEKLSERETKVTTLNGPALCFANHKANGITELRTGKVVKDKNDRHGIWNYSKLVYNTKFPWESMPEGKNFRFSRKNNRNGDIKSSIKKIEEIDSNTGYVESQQYVLEYINTGIPELENVVNKESSEGGDTVLQSGRNMRLPGITPNVTFWHGENNDVLYRRQFFEYEMETEDHWRTAINLADFVVPYGTIRVDKIRMYRRPLRITLGAFGFPDNGTDIEFKEKDGYKAAILKGHDHMGKEKQLALTIMDGWTDIKLIKSTGTNPDSEKSIVLYAETIREKQYGYEPYIMISQVITKEDLSEFDEDDIFPVVNIEYTDTQKCGGYGPVTISLKDGSVKNIDYEKLESHMEL